MRSLLGLMVVVLVGCGGEDGRADDGTSVGTATTDTSGPDEGPSSDPTSMPADTSATTEGDEDLGESSSATSTGGDADLVVWPNAISFANSDPWIAEHHTEIEQMRPRVLALNFVNGRSMEDMNAQLEGMIDVLAEGSRWRGYADPAAKNEVKPRLPQSTVLHHERYDTAPEAGDRPVYDAEMAQFSARNEMGATTWTTRMLNRMGPLKSMNGRERIRATLAKLGFEIR